MRYRFAVWATLFLCWPVASSQAQELSPLVYGCPWNADSLGNLQIGKAIGRRISYRFRAATNKDLASVRVYLIFRTDVREYGRGNGGQVRLELQSDDDTDSHHPSGKTLAETLVIDPMKQEREGRISYRLFTFSHPVRLEAKHLYHLVFSNPAPDPVNNYVSIDDLYSTVRKPQVQPGISDTDLAVIYQYSARDSWAINYAHTPIFCLYFTDGTYGGQAYINARSQSLLCRIAGPNQVREVFTVSGSDRNVTHVRVRLRKCGQSGNLTLQLHEDRHVMETVILSTSAVGGNFDWAVFRFTTTHLLKAGHSYTLLLTAPDGDAYEIYPLQKGTKNGFLSPLLFNDGHFEYTTGGAWQDERKGCDLQFYFTCLAMAK